MKQFLLGILIFTFLISTGFTQEDSEVNSGRVHVDFSSVTDVEERQKLNPSDTVTSNPENVVVSDAECCDKANIACQVRECNILVNSVARLESQTGAFGLASVIVNMFIPRHFTFNGVRSKNCDKCIEPAFTTLFGEEKSKNYTAEMADYKKDLKERILRVRTNNAFKSFHALNNALHGFYGLNAPEIDSMIEGGETKKKDYICTDHKKIIAKLNSTDESNRCGRLKLELGDKFGSTVNARVGEFLHSLDIGTGHGIGDFNNYEEAIATYLGSFDKDQTVENELQCTSRARHAQFLAAEFYSPARQDQVDFLFSMLDESARFGGTESALKDKQEYCDDEENVLSPIDKIIEKLNPDNSEFSAAIFSDPKFQQIKSFLNLINEDIDSSNLAENFRNIIVFAQKFEPGLALILNEKELYCDEVIAPLGNGQQVQLRNIINHEEFKDKDNYAQEVSSFIARAAKCEEQYENIASNLCATPNSVHTVSDEEIQAAQALELHHDGTGYSPSLSQRRQDLLDGALTCSMGGEEQTAQEQLEASRNENLALLYNIEKGLRGDSSENSEEFAISNITYEGFARNSMNKNGECNPISDLKDVRRYYKAVGYSTEEAEQRAQYASQHITTTALTDQMTVSNESLKQAEENYVAGQASRRSGNQRSGRRSISTDFISRVQNGEFLNPLAGASSLTGNSSQTTGTTISDEQSAYDRLLEERAQAEQALAQASRNFQSASQNIRNNSITSEMVEQAETDENLSSQIDELDNAIAQATGKTPEEIEAQRRELLAGKDNSLTDEIEAIVPKRQDLLDQIEELREAIRAGKSPELAEQLAEATTELREAREEIQRLREAQENRGSGSSQRSLAAGESSSTSQVKESVGAGGSSLGISRRPASVSQALTSEELAGIGNEFAAQQIVRGNILKGSQGYDNLVLTYNEGKEMQLTVKNKNFTSRERPFVIFDPESPSEIKEVVFSGEIDSTEDSTFRVPFEQLGEEEKEQVRRYIAENPDKKVVGGIVPSSELPNPEELSQVADLTQRYLAAEEQNKPSLFVELEKAMNDLEQRQDER